MRTWLARIHHTMGRAFFPLLFALLLAGAGYGVLMNNTIKETRELDQRLDNVLLEIDKTRQENERLLVLIETMEESDQVAEKIAREDAHLVKPGEIVLIFPR